MGMWLKRGNHLEAGGWQEPKDMFGTVFVQTRSTHGEEVCIRIISSYFDYFHLVQLPIFFETTHTNPQASLYLCQLDTHGSLSSILTPDATTAYRILHALGL